MGIKQPPAYVHPKKRKAQSVSEGAKSASSSKTNLATTAPVVKPVKAVKGKKEEESGKTLLRLVARVPQAGAIPLFDQMRQSGLSERQALLALMRKGTGRLDAFANLELSAINNLTYEVDVEHPSVETNRMIGTDLHVCLSNLVDPFEALTNRGRGQKIGEALIVLTAQEARHG